MAASFVIPGQPAMLETMHVKLPHSMNYPPPAANPLALTRRSKFKLEPMKILEPSNKKLTLPEAQRLMYILEELVKHFEIIEYFPVLLNLDEKRLLELARANTNDEEQKRNFDQIFVSMCRHHKDLIKSFTEAKTRSTEPGTKSNLSNKTIESLESLIKNSCKDILRVVQNKPALYESIKNEAPKAFKPNQLLVNMINLLKEAKEIMNERLLITPFEHKEKMDCLKELLQREMANNDLIKKLKEEQAAALADKDKEIKLRNDQIRKLDSDIKNVDRFSNELIKRTEGDAEQQESSEIKASDGRKAKLQAELNQLRVQFQTLVNEHRDQEHELRKEKLKHETNVEALINRYDEDMIKKQNEYDEIEEMYEEEKRQLAELDEKFKPLEEEYKKIMEERHMIETMRRMQEEVLNKKIKAAVVIQSYWRGFKLRKGLFKKKKGKGKGKKKK